MDMCMVEGCENRWSAVYVPVFKMPYFNDKRRDKFELEMGEIPLCAEHCAMVRPLSEMDMDEWELIVNRCLTTCEDVPDRAKARMIFRQVRPSMFGR